MGTLAKTQAEARRLGGILNNVFVRDLLPTFRQFHELQINIVPPKLVRLDSAKSVMASAESLARLTRSFDKLAPSSASAVAAVEETASLRTSLAFDAFSHNAANVASLLGEARPFAKVLFSPATVAGWVEAAAKFPIGDALRWDAFANNAAASITLGSKVAGLGWDVRPVSDPFGEGIAKGLGASIQAIVGPPRFDVTGLTAMVERITANSVSSFERMWAGLTPSFDLFAESIRRLEMRRRRRVESWLRELGSGDDPATVELVEVDGVEHGHRWSAWSYSVLGRRVNDALADDEARAIEVGGLAIVPWALRVYRNDSNAFGEVRLPPFGNGLPSLHNIDPERLGACLRVLDGLGLFGYGRRRGRKSLQEVWDCDRFHDAYRYAEAIVRTRRRGRRATQIEIACEMAMAERHLRRLIRRFGLPDENRS